MCNSLHNKSMATCISCQVVPCAVSCVTHLCRYKEGASRVPGPCWESCGMYSIATVHSSGPWGIQYLALYVEFEFVVGQRILFAPTGEAQPAWYSSMPGVAITSQRAKPGAPMCPWIMAIWRRACQLSAHVHQRTDKMCSHWQGHT